MATGESSTSDPGSGVGSEGSAHVSHWIRWHQAYEDPTSYLSRRLRIVQSMMVDALDGMPPVSARAGPIKVVSLCAGQGRDVIDVVSSHPRGAEVSAVLVELDPALVAFARHRAAAAGISGRVRVDAGDASLCSWYVDHVPADLVLVCGVFGNISASDIASTILALRGFCATGGHVIWTRHRRPPDVTPALRADFATAGFTEVAFEAPPGTLMAVGHHVLGLPTTPFDPTRKLFDFVGDGFAPA